MGGASQALPKSKWGFQRSGSPSWQVIGTIRPDLTAPYSVPHTVLVVQAPCWGVEVIRPLGLGNEIAGPRLSAGTVRAPLRGPAARRADSGAG